MLVLGFNYKFDALTQTNPPNELSKAFSRLFHVDAGFSLLPFLQFFVPALSIIVRVTHIHICLQSLSFPSLYANSQPVERNLKQKEARATMRRIGMQLLQDRRREILGQDSFEDKKTVEDEEDDYLAAKGKDLLSALMRANMDEELPESQRIDDEDVLSRASRIHRYYAEYQT